MPVADQDQVTAAMQLIALNTKRKTATATTASLAAGATGNVALTMSKGYRLYSITVSSAAWVRVYMSIADRTADTARAQGVDPAVTAGVNAEFIGVTGALAGRYDAGGHNDETTPTASIPLAVTNNGASAVAVTVTAVYSQVEY